MQQQRGQRKSDVLCKVTARLVAMLDVHVSQFSEPQVHEIPDTCVVTTATEWWLIAGSHGFNEMACKTSAVCAEGTNLIYLKVRSAVRTVASIRVL